MNKGFTFKPSGLAMMEKAKKIFHKKSLTNEMDSIIREESQKSCAKYGNVIEFTVYFAKYDLIELLSFQHPPCSFTYSFSCS